MVHLIGGNRGSIEDTSEMTLTVTEDCASVRLFGEVNVVEIGTLSDCVGRGGSRTDHTLTIVTDLGRERIE